MSDLPRKSIREWREEHYLTLKELAKNVGDKGVKYQTLWNWEVGEAKPTLRHRRELAHALGISPTQIDWDAKATPKRNAA